MSDLRPLPDLEYERPVSPPRDIGHPGELKLIPLNKLLVDRSYQRPVDVAGKRNIRRIAENFRWTRFSPLIVSPREGGKFAIIDGQHRATAAKLHGGIFELPCLVLNCDHQGEADAFSTINGIVTRMQTQYLFRAKLAAGDSTATAVKAACDAAGVRIMPYPVQSDQLKVGETLACGELERCYSRYGAEALSAGLRMITRTGDGNAGLVRRDLISSLSMLFYMNPKWRARETEAREAIEKQGIRKLWSEMLKLAAEQGGGGTAIMTRLISEALSAALGPGADAKPPTKNQVARAEGRKGHAPPALKAANAERAEAAKQRASAEGGNGQAPAIRGNNTATKVVPIRPLPPPMPSRAETPPDDRNFDAVAYLSNKGVKLSRIAGGFMEAGQKRSKADILTTVNRYRRAAELPDLLLADIA
jgi:hypothetical protein